MDYHVIFTFVACLYHVCRPWLSAGQSLEQFKTYCRVQRRSDFSPRPAKSINRLQLFLNLTSTHEQHRLLHRRPLFDGFWPWLSRKALCDWASRQRGPSCVLYEPFNEAATGKLLCCACITMVSLFILMVYFKWHCQSMRILKHQINVHKGWIVIINA